MPTEIEVPSEPQSPVVIVVDDDVVLLRAAARLLERRGLDVHAAEPAEALETASVHSPDIVVSDVTMPGVDVVTLLEKIREVRAGAPTKYILFSAIDDEALEHVARACRADAYVPKTRGILELRAEVVRQWELMRPWRDRAAGAGAADSRLSSTESAPQ